MADANKDQEHRDAPTTRMFDVPDGRLPDPERSGDAPRGSFLEQAQMSDEIRHEMDRNGGDYEAASRTVRERHRGDA